MFKNLKWLRLIPDARGKGGSKHGFHSFQSQPMNDTRTVNGFHVFRGRWRKDFLSQAVASTSPDNGTYRNLSIHAYVYPNLTDPTAQPGLTLLGHNIGLKSAGGQSRYWDFTAGATRDVHSVDAVPAVFANIAGRCFAADGAREGMVLDDRTPAIHAQKNQNLGVGTPAQPLQSSTALGFPDSSTTKIANLTGYGLAYMFKGSARIHTPNPDSPIGTIQTSETVTVGVVEPSYAPISGAAPAAAKPTLPGVSSKTLPGGTFFVGTQTISCASGSSVVTKSTAWPAGTGVQAGLAINFNGYSFMLGPTGQDAAGDQFDVNGDPITLNQFQAVIYGVYDGPTVTNVPFTITGCEVILPANSTLEIAANGGTNGYGQYTRSRLVPVLVSAIGDTNVWFTEYTANNVGFSTAAGVITEYAVPTAASGPARIVTGPDGNMWFTETLTNKVAKVTPAGVVTEFAAGIAGGGAPGGICAGPDGNLWFCVTRGAAGSTIDRITPGGVVTEFGGLPAFPGVMDSICVGPDGNLWFTLDGKDQIGRITALGSGMTFFALNPGDTPQTIVAGPDGNLWFTMSGIDSIGRITPTGTVTYFPGLTVGSQALGLCVGPDGNLWFCERGVDKIGKMTTTGGITEYVVPTAGCGANSICAGRDGNLWFTEDLVGKVAKVTTLGTFTEYAVTAGAGSAPVGITAGGFVRNLGNISISGSSPGVGIPTNPAPWGGPKYAYAWYDPETGHVSNISPITAIATPPAIPASPDIRDYQNITPYFPIDPGAIAYPAGVDATRFSHIIFFRTLSTPGASTLYPIGSLQPFVGKVHPGSASTRGSWNPAPLHGWFGLPNAWVDAPAGSASGPNYFFDFSSDADLLLGGGFRAPQETNSKPMVTLRGGVSQPAYPAHQAYWDGRLWIVPTQQPDTIMFSCDDAQCPFGVPVESFPPTNFLRISAADGRVMGMRTVGEMLLITTERWAYMVAGNNESNYRLLRVSAGMPGVGTYQMDELVSEVEDSASTLYFLGRDGVVYQWRIGTSPIAISAPVQDVLSVGTTGSLSQYQQARVHCVSANARTLVVVTYDTGVSTVPLIYDVTNGVWTSNPADNGSALNNTAPMAMTSIVGLDPPVNEVFSTLQANATAPPGSTLGSYGNVSLRSWLRDDGNSQPFISYIVTFPTSLDGKKTRKQVVGVNVHVAADSGWYVTVRSNEVAGTKTALHAYGSDASTDALYSIYGPGASPVDNYAALDLVALAAEFVRDGSNRSSPLQGYRFEFKIESDNATGPVELYAVDIAYVDVEEQGEGDA